MVETHYIAAISNGIPEISIDRWHHVLFDSTGIINIYQK